MRKYLPLILLAVVLSLVAVACTRPAPPSTAPASPTATPESGDALDGPYPPYPAGTLTPPPTDTPFPTSMPVEPTATATESQVVPTTAPGEPTLTATQVPPTPTVTNTPVASPTPTLPPINVKSELGDPTFTDPMTSSSFNNWSRDGELPDNDNIRLKLEDGFMEVTGRNLLFDTWWFSWPYIEDFFVQMDVNSGTCSGKAAYGLILRGPKRDTGDSWGYIIAFSCDGHYMVRRVDSGVPYQWVDLIGWTPNVNINTGSDQINRVGVRVDGSRFTVYANNFQIATFTDSEYDIGRYGVFINAGQTVNYSYLVNEISYWDFNK